MGFHILVLQSIRYAILALALKLFNYAKFIDDYCVSISHQLEHPNIGTSRTASCRPALDSGHNQQSEPLHILSTPTGQSESLHGDTSSSTSNDWSETEIENHDLASDQSSCSSIHSIASTPKSTPKFTFSRILDAPTSVQLSDLSLSAEASLYPLKQPNAFSFSVADARKAAPAEHGNLFSGGGDVYGLGQNSHGVDRVVAAIDVSSSGGSNEPPVFHWDGTSVTPFTPTIQKENFTTSLSCAYQSITAMQAYNKYSFEELRFADYGIALQSVTDRRDTSTTMSSERHLNSSCTIWHSKTRSVMSEMRDINRELSAWRSGSPSKQASPESGLGLHLLIVGARIYNTGRECIITVLDRTTSKYVRLSEALTWCGGEDRTGLAVAIGTSRSFELLCCSEQLMPSIYQDRTAATIFAWDTESRNFVDLEDMLATKALRARANLRLDRRREHDPRPHYSSECGSTWRDFVASADFDRIIIERLLAKGDVEVAEEIRELLN